MGRNLQAADEVKFLQTEYVELETSKIKLFVDLGDEEKIEIECLEDIKIEDLKQLVAEKLGVTVQEIKLEARRQGRPFFDGKTLKDYRIKDGDTIKEAKSIKRKNE